MVLRPPPRPLTVSVPHPGLLFQSPPPGPRPPIPSYIILTNTQLTYHEKSDSKAKGTLKLEHDMEVTVANSGNHKYVWNETGARAEARGDTERRVGRGRVAVPLLSCRSHFPPRTQHHSSSTPPCSIFFFHHLTLTPTPLHHSTTPPHRYPHCFQLNVGTGKKDTLLVAADTKDNRDEWIKKLGIIKQRLNETYMAGMFSNVRAGTN